MKINSKVLMVSIFVVILISLFIAGSFATGNRLKISDFIFQKSTETNYSEMKFGKFGDCYEVNNDEFLYLKHNIKSVPFNYGKHDSQINKEALIILKTHMLRKEFLKKNDVIISKESIKDSVELMKNNLYEIGSKEDIQFVKDLIESYGVSEDIYWNAIKYYEEERRLVKEYFKEYADIEVQTNIKNEGEYIQDFIFLNSADVFEFDE
ncbi:MAG: hypothetical protein U9N10_11485 [Bacillota bacterium]|nr:hypothetical protein [Bacillota bacterium]